MNGGEKSRKEGRGREDKGSVRHIVPKHFEEIAVTAFKIRFAYG